MLLGGVFRAAGHAGRAGALPRQGPPQPPRHAPLGRLVRRPPRHAPAPPQPHRARPPRHPRRGGRRAGREQGALPRVLGARPRRLPPRGRERGAARGSGSTAPALIRRAEEPRSKRRSAPARTRRSPGGVFGAPTLLRHRGRQDRDLLGPGPAPLRREGRSATQPPPSQPDQPLVEGREVSFFFDYLEPLRVPREHPDRGGRAPRRRPGALAPLPARRPLQGHRHARRPPPRHARAEAPPLRPRHGAAGPTTTASRCASRRAFP